MLKKYEKLLKKKKAVIKKKSDKKTFKIKIVIRYNNMIFSKLWF